MSGVSGRPGGGPRPAPLTGRLLVDVPNWVGDQVMSMPTVERLLDGLRAREAVLLAPPATARLWAEVFPAASVELRSRRGSPFADARRLCGSGRFDVAITLRHASRAKILVRLAARVAVGSEGRGGAVLLDLRWRVDRRRHQVFDAEGLLERLGLGTVDPGWRLRLPAAALESGRRRLAALLPRVSRLLGVAPASGCGDAKRWPATSFGELVARHPDPAAGWVVLVGPGEEEVARRVCAAAGRPLPVVGADADVAELAAVVAGLDALVANDTGPMHLAAFQGVPVVGVFGPTDPSRTGPVASRRSIVASPIDCAPCRRPTCPLGHRRCLDELDVGRVSAALEALLGGAPPAPVVLRPAPAATVMPAPPTADGAAAPAAEWPAPPARAVGRRG